MSAESEEARLPFEPKKKRQKPAKAQAKSVEAPNKTEKKPAASPKKPENKPTVAKESPKKGEQKPTFSKEEMAIPKIVSQRMVRRVAGFCGIPTVLGISSLVGSYLLMTFADIKLPPIAVLLVNLGLFGLGVLGITYGVLSASWDEDRVGSFLGLGEFTTNWGRMVETWRSTRSHDA